MKKHHTIPFFIPHRGCPFKCIFCDQNKITGAVPPSPTDISQKIEKYLATMSGDDLHIEVGFFGGTFTGLPIAQQIEYLSAVQPFISNKFIQGIRLSTRPDFINEEILTILKNNRVTTVELGVQSMSDKVLLAAERGHTAKDVKKASQLITKIGFTLVHQIMLGLPLSTQEDEYFTARCAKNLGAREARLYPVIVIKNTGLAELWQKGVYAPLTENEAITRCAEIIVYFSENSIKVIKCGLHPSEGLLSGSDTLAGPFHPAFGYKVESRIFAMILEKINKADGVKAVRYNPSDEPAVYGYKRCNAFLLNELSKKNVIIHKDNKVPIGTILI